MLPSAGSTAAARIHAPNTSSESSGWRSTISVSRWGLASTTNNSRTGSCTSIICLGSPVRRSEPAPSITPHKPMTLWGIFVPQP